MVTSALKVLVFAKPVLAWIPAVLNSEEHADRSGVPEAFVPNGYAGVLKRLAQVARPTAGARECK